MFFGETGWSLRCRRKKSWDNSWSEYLYSYLCWIKQLKLVIQIHYMKV